jgi:hypothetical protein
MPFRKKHVRWLVLGALGAFIFAPLVAIAIWALRVGGGAMDKELEALLAARLRCRASVRGARPTGLRTAACDAVELAWTAGSGDLKVRLEGVEGERNVLGWSVRAGRGSCVLAGKDSRATLAALNQRLVRTEGEPSLVSVAIPTLALDLDLGDLVLKSDCAVGGLAGEKGVWTIAFRRPDADAQPVRDGEAGPAPATLTLDPTSDRGVFRGLEADLKGVPAARLAGCLPALRPVAGDLAGTFDVALEWKWPEDEPAAARLQVAGTGLVLDEWTAHLPGGPIQGRARLQVTWARTWPEAAALTVAVTGDGGGIIGADALRWLEEALPGAGSCGRLLDGPVGYDELVLRFHSGEGGQASLHDSAGETHILTRLFGEPVLLLWTRPDPFAPGLLWAKVGPALTGPAKEGQAPAPVNRPGG